MAKPKTKAAVKKKPAKAQVRAAVPAKAPKKTAAAKSAAKPAKSAPAKAAKTAAARTTVAKAAAVARTEPKPVAKTPVRDKAEVLKLPAAQRIEAKPAAVPEAPRPAPVLRKAAEAVTAIRADLPPADGFTLLVDGHFKSQFGDLKGAKAAALELKSRFPMLRIEIYDAATKARLPA